MLRKWNGCRVTLLNNRIRVDDRTEPCGTPLLVGLGEKQWLSTTAGNDARNSD